MFSGRLKADQSAPLCVVPASTLLRSCAGTEVANGIQ